MNGAFPSGPSHASVAGVTLDNAKIPGGEACGVLLTGEGPVIFEARRPRVTGPVIFEARRPRVTLR